MYWLTWGAPNRTDRERLWRVLWRAIVTGCDTFLDYLNLAIEASSTALNERNVGRQTHLVYVPPRFHIVQRIEDNIETSKPLHIELGFLDIGMVGLNLDPRVELCRRIFGHQCF